MHRWLKKGFDLIAVGKDDDGQYWPGFGPGRGNTTNWRAAKESNRKPTYDEVKAFWKENNFDLKLACV